MGREKVAELARRRREELANQTGQPPEPAKRPERPKAPALDELATLVGNRWRACLDAAGVVAGGCCCRCGGRAAVEPSGRVSCACRRAEAIDVLAVTFGSRPLASVWLSEWLRDQRRGGAVDAIEAREVLKDDGLSAWHRQAPATRDRRRKGD